MKLKRLLSLLLIAAMVLCLLPTVSFADSNAVISNGTSAYSILLPANASSELQLAAEELNTFLGEIANVTLPVVTDNGAASTAAKWISIGSTSVFTASGNSVGGLKAESSVVKTYQNSILLYGGSDIGAAYAVYDLLGIWFDLEFFTPDFYTYTRNSTVAFTSLNQTKTPVVDHRSICRYETYFTSYKDQFRMRNSPIESYMNTLGHSYYLLLPPSQYYSAHPSWYSNYDTSMGDSAAEWQLCLSNSEMRAQLLANVRAELAAAKARGVTYSYYAICQNDGGGFCTCSSCRLLNLRYSNNSSSYSGAQLALLNEIADACRDEYPDTIFYMLAYTNHSDQAPTKNITASSNVGVMLAPIDCQSTYSYFGNSGTGAYNNGRATDNINDWSAICDHLMMWAYAAQFGDYLCPTNSFDSLAANAAGYNQFGFEVIFQQAHATVLPFFETMKTYLEEKGFYDGAIDTGAAIDNFTSSYYGAAGTAMNNYFYAFLNNIRTFEAKGDRYKSWAAGQYLNGPSYYSPILSTENYSKSYLDTCKGYFDTAYAALGNAYIAGSDEYNTFKKHVDLEYFGVLLSYLQLYRGQLSNAQGAQMVQQIIDIIAENNISVINTATINTWLEAFNVVPETIDFYFFEASDANRACTFVPYTGEANGETFSGVKMTSYAYQPHFKLTAKGAQYVQQFAQEYGYDTVRIHTTANLYNNCFVVNNTLWISDGWGTIDVDIEDFDEDFDFWSQSEGPCTVYLWFELIKSGPISASSFTGISFAKYSGTVGGVTFEGFRGTASSYQPHFHFTQNAVDKIKAYAAEIDAYTMTIHSYANLYNNCFVINNASWVGRSWDSYDVKVSDLTTSFDFWSQSEGMTEVFLWFEFPTAPVGHNSFSGTGWSFENYSGTVSDETFEGVRGTSTVYQPDFYFTQDGIDRITAYATANDYDTLRIHSYPIQRDNGFVINGNWTGLNAWTTTELAIDDLSTSIRFWSQSQGTSEVYLWFEFENSKPITASSFTGTRCSFANGANDTVTMSSSLYQPKFYFTAEGVQRIKDYAAENGYETLRITASYSGTNCLVLNNAGTDKVWVGDAPASISIKIDDLTSAFEFWSQSESTTAVTLSFEFLAHVHSYAAVVTAPTCVAQGYTTHTCECGDAFVDSYISALGHNFVYTNNGDTHTVTCSRCNYSFTETHTFADHVCVCGAFDGVRIDSAALKLDEDINLVYYVSAPDSVDSVYMVFEYMGNSYRVDSYTESTQGKLCFTFEKIAPQCMGQNISATVYMTKNGATVSDTVASYSVRTYCVNQLSNHSDDATLVTLLSDLLTYGAAVQQYTGSQTANPVTNGLTLSPSSAALPTGLVVSYTGTASTAADWESAALGLYNDLLLRLTFTAQNTANLSVRVSINGREETFAASDFEDLGSGKYAINFCGIKATEFGDTVTASFLVGGVQTGRTLCYSVNTYICNYNTISSVPYFAQLMTALYRYGASAEAYQAAH